MFFSPKFLFLAGVVLAPAVPLAAQSSQTSPPAPIVSWGSTRSGSTWTSWAPHDTGYFEADPALAVGNDRLLTGTEPEFAIFFNPAQGDDQYGNFSSSLGEWLGPGLPSPVNGFRITQPQLLLDPACPDGVGNLRQCYILIARAVRASDHAARIVIGTSYWTGPQEFGSWRMFSFDVSHRDTGTPMYGAFPRASLIKNALLITADMFAWDGDRFQFAQVWLLPRSALYSNTKPSFYTEWGFKNADGSLASTIVPAVSYVDSTTTYLVNSLVRTDGKANQLSIRQIDTADPTAPTFALSTFRVPDYSMPPDAEQLGTNTLITTGGTEITNAVLLSNGLWAAQTTGCTPDGDTTQRSCVRWYQIDPVASVVLQQSTLGYAGAHFYYPALAANEAGDMTLAFSGSATYSAAGIYYSGRRAPDPPNALNGFALLHDGDSCYVRPHDGANTLGGRTAVVLDPSDGRSMWIFGAFASGNNSDCQSNGWGTWIGQVRW
jgi:hypothetical protein